MLTAVAVLGNVQGTGLGVVYLLSKALVLYTLYLLTDIRESA